MTTRTRKRLLMAAGTVLAVAALVFHYKQRDSYRCQICFAKKDVFQWRLGFWQGASMPLTPRWERTTDTHFQRDFLSVDHVHDWTFAQCSPYHFFGTTWGGCAIGGGRYVSELSEMYESSEQFRSFIAQRLRDGSFPDPTSLR